MTLTRVIIMQDYESLAEGSVFEATERDGKWVGVHSSMNGSFMVEVPMEVCAPWNEEKHDAVLFRLKRVMAEERERRIKLDELAELARLKAKYE